MKTTSIILTILLLLVLPERGQAQQEEVQVPRFTLKTNVISPLFSFKQSVMLTTDVRLAPRLSVDVGGGMTFHSIVFAETEGTSYRGPRLRGGIKYHLGLDERSTFHVGLEGKYNHITHRFWENVLRQGGQYRQLMLVDRLVRSQGLALRLGAQTQRGSRRQWLFEVSMGVGGVVHRVSIQRPPDADLAFFGGRLFDWRYREGRSVTLELPFAVHVGYAIW